MNWKDVASDIQLASDYLTDQVRSYVVVGKKKYMDNYFEEANVTKRREIDLEVFENNLHDSDIYTYVETATKESMDLMNLEYYAMRLVADVKGTDYSNHPEITNVVITTEDAALNDEAKLERAINIVYGETYTDKKDIITFNINHAVTGLDTLMEKDVLRASDDLKNIMIFQQTLITINILFLIGLVLILAFFVIKPANRAVKALEDDRTVTISGIKEFSFIANTYNKIHEQNKHVKEKLIFEAEHDKLTGLYNRTGYITIYHRMTLNKVTYVLLDVDNFKEINDKYGHSIGDKVLVRLSKAINKFFESDENTYIFRIGGDEFSILIEDDSLVIDDLVKKLKNMDKELSNPEKDVPGLTLSIGIAHGKGADTTDTLFKKADKALYRVKKHGRDNIMMSE